MRNVEQRVEAVKLRTREIEIQKRIHKRRILYISVLAACLIFIIGLSYVMPGLMNYMSDYEHADFNTAASMFDGSNFFGFVLTGFLAFVLGISITILAYKIKQKNREDQEKNND